MDGQRGSESSATEEWTVITGGGDQQRRVWLRWLRCIRLYWSLRHMRKMFGILSQQFREVKNGAGHAGSSGGRDAMGSGAAWPPSRALGIGPRIGFHRSLWNWGRFGQRVIRSVMLGKRWSSVGRALQAWKERPHGRLGWQNAGALIRRGMDWIQESQAFVMPCVIYRSRLLLVE